MKQCYTNKFAIFLLTIPSLIMSGDKPQSDTPFSFVLKMSQVNNNTRNVEVIERSPLNTLEQQSLQKNIGSNISIFPRIQISPIKAILLGSLGLYVLFLGRLHYLIMKLDHAKWVSWKRELSLSSLALLGREEIVSQMVSELYYETARNQESESSRMTILCQEVREEYNIYNSFLTLYERLCSCKLKNFLFVSEEALINIYKQFERIGFLKSLLDQQVNKPQIPPPPVSEVITRSGSTSRCHSIALKKYIADLV